MGDAFPRFRVKRYVLRGGDSPIPLVAPISCCFIGWFNKGSIDVSLSTPPYDDESFDTVTPNTGGMIVTPMAGPRELAPRFQLGEELARLKLDSNSGGDTGLMIVQFVF